MKSNLGSVDIETTLKKCQRFKNMYIKMQKDASVFGNMSDIKRLVDKRPFFQFAFKSQLTLETIHKKVLEYNEENNLAIQQQIDGIYILDRGTITNYGNGKGQLRFKYSEPGSIGEFATGYVPDGQIYVVGDMKRVSNQKQSIASQVS